MVSTASTRYPGGSVRWRNETAGCQYAAVPDGSWLERARLHASGERFQEHASANATAATGQGRQRRSESVSAVVYPWEISVGREHQADSALNVIEAEVRSVVHVAHRVRVQIGPVIAEVTQASVDKLGLVTGARAVASFKATGTRLVPYA